MMIDTKKKRKQEQRKTYRKGETLEEIARMKDNRVYIRVIIAYTVT